LTYLNLGGTSLDLEMLQHITTACRHLEVLKVADCRKMSGKALKGGWATWLNTMKNDEEEEERPLRRLRTLKLRRSVGIIHVTVPVIETLTISSLPAAGDHGLVIHLPPPRRLSTINFAGHLLSQRLSNLHERFLHRPSRPPLTLAET
jgi:hypothetical protein